MQLPHIQETEVAGKTVFLRADLNVPLSEQGAIDDDSRLTASLPTMHYLLENNASILLSSHLGRPNGVDPTLSLKPVAQWFQKNLTSNSNDITHTYEKRGEFWGWKISETLFLLENLRFYDGEKQNDPKFAKTLASMAQIYVNDAFAVSHRRHASIVGVPQFLPHFAGLHLQKEVASLTKILENPTRPLIVVIGGVKIETKLPLIAKMEQLAESVLVGGKLADEARNLAEFQNGQNHKKVLLATLNSDKTDISKESADKFLEILIGAGTIVWNGPLGKSDQTEQTARIAEGIIASSAYTVVGGGDTLEFLRKHNLLERFSFCSTGGGAMLAFLSGEVLPGLDILEK